MKRIGNRTGVLFGATALFAAAVLGPRTATHATQTPERAVWADAFVDTIGVVTHFNFERTYTSNDTAVIELLADSGIRHIRDGFGDARARDRLARLAARGVKVDLVTDDRQSLKSIVDYPSLLPPGAVDAIEGPNELDLFRGGDVYIGILRAFVPALYQAVKGDPRTRSIPVIGPSLTTARAYAAVGDLSAYLDYGNMHNYVFGRNPGTAGWNGATHYGSIAFMMNAAAKVSGVKPIMTTEIGDGTSLRPGELNDATQLRYLMRIFFEQALNGVVRTYVYEFLDDGAATTNSYGLVRRDLTVKPSYTGMRNLINLLRDSGAPRAQTLRYAVNAPETVHHYLLEKSDGTFYLALWNEVPSFALRPGGDDRESHVPAVNANVALDGAIRNAKVSTFDQSGNITTSAPSVVGSTIDVPVTDSVSIVQWRPIHS